MAFFDATKVAPDQGRGDPFPLGWYVAVLLKLDVGPTSDGQGTKANGEFEIFDGPYKGRKVYHNFNMQNQSEKAQEIGHKQMSALCHAVEVMVPEVPEQLYGRPMKIRCKVTPADGQYEAKNEITAFKTVNDPTAVSAPVAEKALNPSVPQQSKPWVAPAAAAAQQPAQSWAQPAGAQPWQQPAAAAPAQPVQTAPAWNAQPVQEAAPVQQQAAPVEVQQQAAAPQGATPPWMQQPQS